METIRGLFIQNGWVAYKEKKDIDLVLEKDETIIALEVETGSNNSKQTAKNIDKLISYKADKKYVITTNPVALHKTQILLSDINLPGIDSIQITPVRDFIKSLPFNS